MKTKFDDLENAFHWVSMDQKFMHSAILCRETGKIFYTSEMGDSDELPEDIDDSDRYIDIPHKNDLELGKTLAIDFTTKFLPEALDKVYSIFSRKGAYSNFKELLDGKGMLDNWYKFENDEQNKVLRDWCQENNIEIEG